MYACTYRNREWTNKGTGKRKSERENKWERERESKREHDHILIISLDIYYLFSNICSPWLVSYIGINFYYCGSETDKIVFYLFSPVWILSGRFLSFPVTSYLYEINNIQKNGKEKTLSSLLPLADRWPLILGYICSLF